MKLSLRTTGTADYARLWRPLPLPPRLLRLALEHLDAVDHDSWPIVFPSLHVRTIGRSVPAVAKIRGSR